MTTKAQNATLPEASTQVLDEAINNFTCKAGSQRSLALAATKTMKELQVPGDPAGLGWEFAKTVSTANKDFTEDEARATLKVFVAGKINAKPAVTAKDKKDASAKTPAAKKEAGAAKAPAARRERAASTTPEAKALSQGDEIYAKDEKEPKNARIRTLLGKGYEVSIVAKAMGLTYQRVKNVKKAIDRQAETAKTATAAAA